jgi:HAE1 family hydrophobic/amphiphilic exporter-1
LLARVAVLILLLGVPALLIARRSNRLLAVGVIVATLLVTFGVKRFFGFQFFPPMDQGQVGISIEMPAGTRLEVTDEVIRQIEGIVSNIPEVENVFTNVGMVTGGHFGAGESGGQYGQVMLSLIDRENVLHKLWPFGRPEHTRTRADTQIAAELRRKLLAFPGAILKVTTSAGFGGMEAPLQINLRGNDTRVLNDLALRMRDQLKEVPGILNPDVSWRVGRPEVQVRIDRVRAAEMGFSVGEIATTLRDALEGNTTAKYREAGDEYDIRVQLAEFDRRRLADVAEIILGTVDGQIVRLRDVASVEIGSGPTRIDREDRQRQVQVLAFLAPGSPLGNVETEIKKRGITDLHTEGVTLEWGGQSEIMRESAGYMGTALLLSIVLVYMLLAALFESFLNPFIIMLSLPMALIGALVALVLTGQTMSIIAMIGFIMLVGLVTKNAILLIDYTNTLRGRGEPRNQAVLEAGPTRLRPILMTTLALALALTPIASGIGEAAEMRQSMAIAVIGGLLLSTLLTLVVIPVVYTLFDDLTAWLRRVKRRVVRGV